MKPHAVLIPFPFQGHITPMLRLAKILHSRGFFITFVSTESSHNQLIRAQGPASVTGLEEDFQFKSIPDLPPFDKDVARDMPQIWDSLNKERMLPFLELIKSLNESPDCPDVSCIVSDGIMSFTLYAAEKLDIPEVVFFTVSACGFWCYCHFDELVNRGLFPLKDESQMTNGYLETELDWVPGMKHIRLRDFPTYIRTTDPDDHMVNTSIMLMENAARAKAVVINTYDELESRVIDEMRKKFSHVSAIGPLQLLEREVGNPEVRSIGLSLWKQDDVCIAWLNRRAPGSVLYVNFGSLAVLLPQELMELAWGLANSGQCFLWVIRPDLLDGESAVFPGEYLREVEGRAMMAGWCSQDDVLAHPAVGGFLTHCGWNSTIESMSEGVPMICWPFSAEQTTNCRYACGDWEIGLEIEGEVKREKVGEMVKMLMEGEKGREMREKALEWKNKAEAAAKPGGSSYHNLEVLINQILLNK